MSPSLPPFFARLLADDRRALVSTAVATGVAAVVLGALLVSGWLFVATDGTRRVGGIGGVFAALKPWQYTHGASRRLSCDIEKGVSRGSTLTPLRILSK